MAGRGTDIQLGGNVDMRIKQELEGIEDEAEHEKKAQGIRDEVAAARDIVLGAGGLFVLATERHESRRIDNQLRGRSGRQGDPGTSRFFLSLEDDLMRIFGSERIDGMLQKLGLEEGEAIVHRWVNKALEKAQEKVEARNFEIRKNLLKFDDVMNDQRKVIYEQRKELMDVTDVSATVTEMRHEVIKNMVERCMPEHAYVEQWDTGSLHEEVLRVLGVDLPVQDWAREEGIADTEVRERLIDITNRRMAEKAANYGPEIMRSVEKSLLLQILDQVWKEHLLTLDHLRQGIGLRAYGQKDPLNEYKRESFGLFEEMLETVRERVTSVLCHVELELTPNEDLFIPRQELEMEETRTDPAFAMAGADIDEAPMPQAATVRVRRAAETIDPTNPNTWGRVARNKACPCGSGKKYKHCHGKVA